MFENTNKEQNIQNLPVVESYKFGQEYIPIGSKGNPKFWTLEGISMVLTFQLCFTAVT